MVSSGEGLRAQQTLRNQLNPAIFIEEKMNISLVRFYTFLKPLPLPLYSTDTVPVLVSNVSDPPSLCSR
jgi:hypothetical protein